MGWIGFAEQISAINTLSKFLTIMKKIPADATLVQIGSTPPLLP
jgi:hypothetical protein